VREVSDIKRTGAFDLYGARIASSLAKAPQAPTVVQGMPSAAAILDASGIVRSANAALAELLGLERSRLEDEPWLTWIRGQGEREAFGREFLGLRARGDGDAFVRDLDLRPQLGPVIRCKVRACRLSHGQVLVTVQRAEVSDPEAELGRAVTRALDALDQGVFLVDGEGRIVHVNPAAQKLLGSGLVGRSFLDIIAHGRVDELARALSLSRAGSWHGEVDLTRSDGDVLPVELSLAGGSGQGAPVVVLCRDLRARRRRRFDERLTRQVDRALVSSSEPREALTVAAQAIATALAADRVVILTHLGKAGGGTWERWVVRPDAPAAYEILEEGARPEPEWALQEGVTPLLEFSAEDQRIFGRMGASLRGARIVLRASGGVVGYLLVTHRPRARWTEHEHELIAQLAPQLALGLANGLLMLETRALAAYQGRVLDQTAVIIDSVDAQGRVVTWNRASEKLFGMSAADAEGKLFGTEVARAREPERWSELWQELNRGGVVSSEMAVLDHNGESIPIHIEGRLLRDGNETRGAVFVGLDLRVRRALENQVASSQKMAAVGLLAAGIAHEINNPLSGVVGYSTLLLERRDLPADIRHKVQKISDSGERCRKIVEGVLLFSRQSGGDREPVQLAELIDGVVRIGEYQWKMSNCRVVQELEASVEVLADKDQLEQVLLNLLSNAVDAMDRGGTVRIALRSTETTAEIHVSDEGPGIAEEIQPNVFDPFFSTKSIGKGTGLGLSISYGIVRDHGGDILLESKPGEGAHFTVVLPKAPPG
jgi:PAS domain S-box-containing protein